MEATKTELSLGEKRVRINFNPSDNSMVFTIKTKAAELINLLDTLEAKGDPEIARLKALGY